MGWGATALCCCIHTAARPFYSMQCCCKPMLDTCVHPYMPTADYCILHRAHKLPQLNAVKCMQNTNEPGGWRCCCAGITASVIKILNVTDATSTRRSRSLLEVGINVNYEITDLPQTKAQSVQATIAPTNTASVATITSALVQAGVGNVQVAGEHHCRCTCASHTRTCTHPPTHTYTHTEYATHAICGKRAMTA